MNEPASGYVWGNVAAHSKTHYNFGEYIASTFCGARANASSQDGPVLEGTTCQHDAIQPGGTIPAEWGGGVSKWPWAIPLLAKNVPTKPELVGHFAPEAPDFNLQVPDQIRMNVFLKHFEGWVADRAAGKDTMPNLHHDAAGERPYIWNEARRADAEVVGGGQRPSGGTNCGSDLAFGILG